MFTFQSKVPLLEDIRSVTNDKGRVYVTPDGREYVSVTTFLNSMSESYIEQWKKEVGEEYAEEVSLRARSRGTRYHNMVEKYLKCGDRKEVLDSTLWPMKEMFLDSEETLNRINNIHFIEQALYSDRLRLAGRVDVIAEFDSVLSIIDFKTSTREKHESEIENYFLQATAYAMMYEECSFYTIGQIVIVMLCDDLPRPIVFRKNPKQYHNALLAKLDDFHASRKLSG